MVWGESRLAGKFATAVSATWDRYREELGKSATTDHSVQEPPKPSSEAKVPAVAPPPELPPAGAPAAHAGATSPGAVRGSDPEAQDPPAGSGKPVDGAKSGDAAAGKAPEKSAVPAPIPPKKPVSYKEDLLPILKDRCFECHIGDKPKDGVGFDHMEELIKKEGKRAVVMKGDPTRSTMFTSVMKGDDSKKRMPPPKEGKRLTPEQAGIIQAWIKEGARLDN
jgi:hypothetical protein